MVNMDVFIYGGNLPTHLSKDEFSYYYSLFKNNNDIEARNKIIESNLTLVYKIVTSYYDFSAIIKDDIISIGTMGLINAVNTYDINKNCNFSTYAVPCIINEINAYYNRTKKNLFPKLSLDSLNTDKENRYQTIDYTYEDLINNINDKDYLEYLFEILSPRDKDILKMSFGLEEYDRPYKEYEIAEKYGFATLQMVSFIVRDRLKRLKKASEDNQYRKKQLLKRQRNVN